MCVCMRAGMRAGVHVLLVVSHTVTGSMRVSGPSGI